MIAYEGPSLINGDPIALILTSNSINAKTGTMIQSWIIPVKDNVLVNDEAVCGDCIMREGACYVTKVFAPSNVQKSYRAGKYKAFQSSDLRHEILRIGSWGDPAAVPADIWLNLLRRTQLSDKYTGYTHQWRTCDPIFATFCMASVETLEDAKLAQSMGYSTFRVKEAYEPKQPNETLCLNQTIGITCKQCLLCNTSSGDIAIDVHGTNRTVNKYREIRLTLSTTERTDDTSHINKGSD